MVLQVRVTDGRPRASKLEEQERTDGAQQVCSGSGREGRIRALGGAPLRAERLMMIINPVEQSGAGQELRSCRPN